MDVVLDPHWPPTRRHIVEDEDGWLDPCAILDATVLLGTDETLARLNPNLVQNVEFAAKCEAKYAVGRTWIRAIRAAQAGAWGRMGLKTPAALESRPVAAMFQPDLWGSTYGL